MSPKHIRTALSMNISLVVEGVQESDGAVVNRLDRWVLVIPVQTSHDTVVVRVDKVGDRHARVPAVLGTLRRDDAVFL